MEQELERIDLLELLREQLDGAAAEATARADAPPMLCSLLRAALVEVGAAHDAERAQRIGRQALGEWRSWVAEIDARASSGG